MKTATTPSPPRPKRYRAFWFVLYPNEDINHKKMLDYLLNKERFQVFYIEHNRCKVTANSKLVKEGKANVGDPIKPHTHVFVKFKNGREQMSVETFSKWFDGWINPNEPRGASSADSCAEYFLHENPSSINEGKVAYNFNEIKGDEDFIGKLVLGQNTHFVQWQSILPMLRKGYTIADIMDKCFSMDNDVESKRFMDFILANQYLLLGMSNQEINRNKRDR